MVSVAEVLSSLKVNWATSTYGGIEKALRVAGLQIGHIYQALAITQAMIVSYHK